MRSSVAIAAARSLVEACPLAVAAALSIRGLRREPSLLLLWVETAALLLAWTMLTPRLRQRDRALAAFATVLVVALAAVQWTGGRAEPSWPAAALVGSLYAAIVVWRSAAIDLTLGSWRAAAWAAGVAAVAITIVGPALGDASEVVVVAIAGGIAATVALSLARGLEETFALGQGGPTRGLPGWASSVAVAAGALVVAAVFPSLRPTLGDVAERLAPYAEALLVIIVTPFIYLVDAFVRAIIPLLLRIHIDIPARPISLEQQQAEAEYARAVSEQARILLERAVSVIVLAIVVALLARVVLARIASSRASAPLDRERIAGASLGELARDMFGASAPARASRPSGSDPAARVRRAYWDLLALAERAGPGWREPAQTPREHRAGLHGDLWSRADAVVAAFERFRYGPGARVSDAEEAERALRDVLDAVSSTA